MKKKICSFFVLLGIFTFAQGPGFNWAKNITGSGSSTGVSITTDISGAIYTTGGFYGTADFDTGPGVYTLATVGAQNDVYISKLDASGNFVWAKSLNGFGNDEGSSVVVDASGNVYITGFFTGTLDFDPSPSTFSLTAIGGQDIFILKLDASGNFVWAKTFGGLSDDVGNCINLDATGNVYCCGAFQATVDFDPGAGIFNINSLGLYDVFILKLDNSGNFVWAKNMSGTGSESAAEMSLDAAGNVYGTGTFGGTVDFDPGAATFNINTVSGAFDVFVFKLNASGNFVWAKSMGGSYDDFSYAITLDASGNIYTTGSFKGTADFDPGAPVFNLITGTFWTDIFISKLDASGNFVWAKGITENGPGGADNAGRSIKVDGFGNVYTIGYFEGVLDFDPGAGIFNLSSLSNFDVFISKLDPLGDYKWAGRIGGGSWDTGYSITLDVLGNLCATGRFIGNVDFDPDAGIFDLTSLTNSSAFILKMSPCCAGINELANNTRNILPYPNPNNGVFNLNIEDDIEGGELVLFNTLGQIVYEQKIIKGFNQINTSALAKGIYNCRLTGSQQKLEIGKLVIE
jgi:hypothetical protein